MEELLSEPVDVLATFKERVVTPRRFRWQGRVLTVKTLNLTYRVKNGGATYRYFSVSAPGGTYLLRFDPIDLSWLLESVYPSDE